MIGALGAILFGWGLWRDHVESKRLGLEKSRERWLIIRLVKWLKHPSAHPSFTLGLTILGWAMLVFALVAQL